MSNSFNFDEALKDLQSGKDLTGKDGINRSKSYVIV